jgi:hypothetical protein
MGMMLTGRRVSANEGARHDAIGSDRAPVTRE